jgi:protein gp37
MSKTTIEWVVDPDGKSQGRTWNPVTGCHHGCKYCYAERTSNRFRGEPLRTKLAEKKEVQQVINGKIEDRILSAWPAFDIPTLWKARLSEPSAEKKPRTIFVPSMADLFGEWVPKEWIDAVLKTVRECPQHTFLFLTKKPSRYLEFDIPNNCWLGATTDTPTSSALRSEALTIAGNNNKFISAEPLLGDISGYVDYDGLDWIIIGSLNASNSPVPASRGGTHREWVTNLIKEAKGIPVFIKDGLYDLYSDLPRLRGLPYLGKTEKI